MAALAVLAVIGAIAGAQLGNNDREATPYSADPNAAAVVGEPLRYDTEYPSMNYATAKLTDPVAHLQERIARGETTLRFEAQRGYLDSLLQELQIDASSQTLVFSGTSLQSRRINPRTPRAIYFNDDVYVAWVQNGPIEIASMDPNLGPVYYLLEQTDSAPAAFGREQARCLGCHDSYSLSGGGVPRFIVGSGYTGPAGNLISHEGWILVTDRTPLKSRWGGWYVTGQHGDQVHLGNMVIADLEDFKRLEEMRINNIDTLDGLFDTKPYLTNKSDIVALMILEHQANVQNWIARVSWDTRTALHAAPNSAETQALIESSVEPLVEALLFVKEVKLTAPLSGEPKFTAQFASRAVRDKQGRSLRDLDMTTRMMRYPLSYAIYSDAFNALPDPTKQAVYRRLAHVLRGEDQTETYAALAGSDRSAILEILTDTKPDFAAAL